jgi:hypothetical protein
VILGCRNCLASGATFFFWGTSTTKWSVHSHRVYKDSFHRTFYSWPLGLSHCPFLYVPLGINSINVFISCIFLVK